jgi:uncharacterized protein with PIN domain
MEQDDLARRSQVSVMTIRRLETAGGLPRSTDRADDERRRHRVLAGTRCVDRPVGHQVRSHAEALTEAARQAFLHFGKGRNPARLNFGDCASNALAKSEGAALLFKGNDFSRTDIVAAL